jgi:hypothetical protein
MQVFDDRFQAESGWNCNCMTNLTLHFSGIISAHLQEFSTVYSALLSFMQVFDDLHETYQCRTYSRELLMMGREDARKL